MDWSIIEGEPKKVIVKGRINAIFPLGWEVRPLSNYLTVTLYPSKGKVFYLKFSTEEELKRQSFTVNEIVVVEGILRIIDGKQIIANVKRIKEPYS